MYDAVREGLQAEVQAIEAAGLRKRERTLTGPQGARVRLADGREVLNFCANNYLGLATHPRVVAAARASLDSHGFGMASVRFICGTQDLHRDLERDLASFLGFDDAILYSSCFDANGGLFEALLGEEDAIVSDALNHASIIDGIRLSKARRFRYEHADLADLEERLGEAERAGARRILVVTDGVFSMDGHVADLPGVCAAAERHGALVMVDDSHATGFVGRSGRGTPEFHGVQGRVDILTSTLGKALGGASGGFTCARQAIVDLLRQRSRPYNFSNTVAPPVAAAAREALRIVTESTALRDRLEHNARRFRAGVRAAGFEVIEGWHPIVPILLGEARRAADMADALLAEGVYAIGFWYPVVPKGQARIRVQLSAAHEPSDVDRAVEAFARVGRALRVLPS